MPGARAITLLAVGLAAPAAGCGADHRAGDDYARALNTARARLVTRFDGLDRQIAPTSTPAQQDRTLRAYESAVGGTVTELRRLRVPGGLLALHRRLVADVAGYGTALRTARAGLRSGDPQQVLAAQGRLRDAVGRARARLDATIRAINAKLGG